MLFAHLVLFGFVYPGSRAEVPAWVMAQLLQRLAGEQALPPPPDRLCRGTLLSREQYLFDVEQLGYQDARLAPLGSMASEELQVWTEAIPGRQDGGPGDESGNEPGNGPADGPAGGPA